MRTSVVLPALATAAITAVVLSGCSTTPSEAPATSSGVDAASAETAEDFGGLEELVAAAQAEGSLNVIALPDDWANYGAVKALFQETYGITVNSMLPDASSAEEIAAADQNRGTDQAPDVFDLGTNVTVASVDHFAPYRVASWDDIPEENREETGLWVNDYTGIMSVGYNATQFGEITSLEQLTDPQFRGLVALNGNPTEAGAAFNGFLMANTALGGTLDELQPGLDYFRSLQEAGTLNVQDVTAATIDSGTHGVVFDWSYNHVSTQARLAEHGVDWQIFVPEGGEIAAYYNQAVNVDAPHPAAARLWMEFLYSPEAQNLWLAGGARPVLYDAMEAGGTLDTEAAETLPEIDTAPQQASVAQAEAANAVLQEQWPQVVAP